MWFWMNKAIKIGIDQWTLLVLIFNSCCFDHDDVTWVQKVRVLENKKKEDETWSFREKEEEL